MINRFWAYIDKVFHFREQAATLTDSRQQPMITTQAVFATAFTMFATGRGSLNAIDKERHFPGRLQNFVGPQMPSADTIGRVYSQLESDTLRQMLAAFNLCIKRNKMINTTTGWFFAAVDGHEFFRQPQTLLQSVLDPHLDSG